MGGIDWGDAPTWFAGVFAALAAYYTRGMLRSQRKQIDEQRQFIAAQSANLTLERRELEAIAAERREGQARAVRLQSIADLVLVYNESPAAIRDVTCFVDSREAGGTNVARIADAASNLGMAIRAVPDWPVPVDVPPGSLAAFDRTRHADVRVLFTDSAGVRWSLDEHNELGPAEPGRD
ncbi:hypothetical protein OG735_18090 [Streptomyces sp. NBC_01210]|uniref:hypothetical protein n=1 Tax=Streptomyces sp. NBC_01210 TaxID=2903774 RepID=UPI002E143DAE|nr:hypothetical protein OG735_18090 [Streptomyces sp. NBC_01210]